MAAKVNTKITETKFRHHLHYDGWRYAAGFVAILLGWWLIFTLTEEKISSYQSLDIALMGLLEDDRPLTHQMDKIKEEGIIDLKAIRVSNIQYVGTDAEDYGDNSGETRLMLTIVSKEMDIYILPREFYNSLAAQGAFLPLDDYIEDGTLDPGALNFAPVRKMAMEGLPDEFAENLYVEKIYGIPADTLTDLYKVGFNPTGCVVAVTVFSENRQDSLTMLQWMYDNFCGQHPDMLVEY